MKLVKRFYLYTVILLIISIFVSAGNWNYLDVGQIGGEGDTGESEFSLNENEIIVGKTSYLEILGGIACNSNARNSDKITYWDYHYWYDGVGIDGFTGDVDYEDSKGTPLSLTFKNEGSCCASGYCREQSGTDENGRPQYRNVPCNCAAGDGLCGIYDVCTSSTSTGWPDVSPSCFDSYNPNANSYEPYLQFDPTSDGYPTNPMFVRFEGDCRMFGRLAHKKNPPMASSGEIEFDNPNAYFLYEEDSGAWLGDQTYKVFPGFLTYDVDWDNDQAQCEQIGGDWLEEGELSGISASDFEGYRCCGDDWVWLYNIPITQIDSDAGTDSPEDLALEDAYCLYSYFPNYGDAINVEGMGNYTTSDSRCSAPDHHTSYDVAVIHKDSEQDGSYVANPYAPFYFVGTYPKETDIGKWSSVDTDGLGKWSDDNQPETAYCHHEYQSGVGEVFEWLTVPQAAEKNQLICEVYLGYNWTGNRCCGYSYDTFEDNATSCNAKDLVYQLSRQNYPYFSSPAFEENFFDECNLTKTLNNACFRGRGVGHNTFTYSSDGVYDVYSENGELFFCRRASGNLSEYKNEDYDIVDKCQIMGEEVNEVTVCGYTDDSWFDVNSAQEFLGFNYIELEENNVEYVESRLHTSSLPFEIGMMQPTECCFFDSCWNGTECVSELEGKYVYNESSQKWFGFEGELLEENEDEIKYFACDKGDWYSTEPRFNWFHDTSDVGFCALNHSCLCRQSTSYPYNYVCGDDTVVRDCTTEENYYYKDHYCEAIYNDEETAISSEWTTRTKMIAQQMLDLAGEDEYTLYCDEMDSSINYPVELEQTRYPLNNVCVLDSNGKRIIGFSFNPTDNNEVPLREFLFSYTNGFVTNVLGDQSYGADMCNALVKTSNGTHGDFIQCLYPTLWANNKTLSVIYSVDPLDDEEIMPTPDYNIYRKTLFDAEKNVTRASLDQDDALPYFSMFRYPSDYNRIYLMKNGSKSIFATIEQRYDKWTTVPPKLRYYLSVHYKGFNSTCSWVDFVKKRDNLDIHCFDVGEEESIVFARTSIFQPDYWKDLTAKLRLVSND